LQAFINEDILKIIFAKFIGGFHMAMVSILLPILALAVLSIFAGYIALVLLLLRQGKIILGLILPFVFLILGSFILIPIIIFGLHLTRLLFIIGLCAMIFSIAGFIAALIGKLISDDNRNL
jgi:hypothetical protein